MHAQKSVISVVGLSDKRGRPIKKARWQITNYVITSHVTLLQRFIRDGYMMNIQSWAHYVIYLTIIRLHNLLSEGWTTFPNLPSLHQVCTLCYWVAQASCHKVLFAQKFPRLDYLAFLSCLWADNLCMLGVWAEYHVLLVRRSQSLKIYE